MPGHPFYHWDRGGTPESDMHMDQYRVPTKSPVFHRPQQPGWTMFISIYKKASAPVRAMRDMRVGIARKRKT